MAHWNEQSSSSAGGQHHSRASSSTAPYSSNLVVAPLPPPPASYEDFEYSTSFNDLLDFDMGPHDPDEFARHSAPPPPPADYHAAQSFPHATSAPSPPAPPRGYAHSATPPTFHFGASSASSDMAGSLLDSSEMSTFTNFLSVLDTNQNFLFNPVLPPGMPSPPQAFLRSNEEQERDTLGRDLRAVDLGFRDEDDAAAVKREEDEDHARSILGQSIIRQSGSRTRAGGFQGGRGKKLRVGDDYASDQDAPDDVSMGFNGAQSSDESAATGTMTTRRRGARQSNGSTPSSTPAAASRPAAPRRVAPPGAAPVARSRPINAFRRAASPPSTTPLMSSYSPSGSPFSEGGPSPPCTTFPPTSHPPPSLPPSTNSPYPQHLSNEDAEGEDEDDASDRKVPLTDSQKRSNHILSEQKRRNAIRLGFKDLVDLLSNGESASGIAIAGMAGVGDDDPEEGAAPTTTAAKKKKGGAGTGPGRGRGRKGDVGAGASKSVVLEKATVYIGWLQRGNEALEMEVRRVEQRLNGVDISPAAR